MVNIAAQAAEAAARGNEMLQDYRNKAGESRGQYQTYSAQADQANKNVSDYTDYMKGAGSASNQYDLALNQKKTDLGYDPQQMTAARANLNQAQGAMSAYSDFANTAASKWGMNAGGFAAANAGALGSLNNNIASNQGVVNGLSDIYKTAQTGANEKTGLVLQGQRDTLSGLESTFTNAANQRDAAAQMMTFYEDQAQKQGGLNAQQQQYYAAAVQAYAQSEQAMAQATLVRQQIKQTEAYMASPAYQAALNPPKPTATPQLGARMPVDNPTADDVRKAAQYSKDVSGPLHGLGNMDLLSWFRGHY